MSRTVVVTGGGSGIGAAISAAFHGAGDAVVIASRTDNGFASKLGARAHHVSCDVRIPSEAESLFEKVAKVAGPVTVLVNNAGFSRWSAMDDVDETFWNELMDTNLKGVFFVTRAAVRRMGEGGCVVNVSSLAGKRGSANNSVYCASKFGVNGLTQALAKELGVRKIRVNAVCPVYVQSDGLMSALGDVASPAGGADVASYLADFAAGQAALKRLPEAAEIAKACVFLASDQASAITGQCINVDCGVMPS